MSNKMTIDLNVFCPLIKDIIRAIQVALLLLQYRELNKCGSIPISPSN